MTEHAAHITDPTDPLEPPLESLIQQKYQGKLGAGIIALALLLIGYFSLLAGQLNIHYYDSFQYLNCAKALAGLPSYYDFTRPPTLQLLLTPIMVAYRISGAPFWLERAPYFAMLVINGVALWAAWRLLRAGLAREMALIMLAALLINRSESTRLNSSQ